MFPWNTPWDLLSHRHAPEVFCASNSAAVLLHSSELGCSHTTAIRSKAMTEEHHAVKSKELKLFCLKKVPYQKFQLYSQLTGTQLKSQIDKRNFSRDLTALQSLSRNLSSRKYFTMRLIFTAYFAQFWAHTSTQSRMFFSNSLKSNLIFFSKLENGE